MNTRDIRPGKTKALFMARKLFVELLHGFTELETMNMTIPDIQTILSGITIGGRKISDINKVLTMAKAWEELIDSVQNDRFTLDKSAACLLQSFVAKDEALEIGQFRNGPVGISGTAYAPPDAQNLASIFEDLLKEVRSILDIRERGIVFALASARNQFFWDGNKRTGMLMMNGLLMSEGYIPLNIPASLVHEYNMKMLKFYETGDMKEMREFMVGCHGKSYM